MTQDDISDFIDDILENVTDNRPMGRYGHAAEKVLGGFVIFGGKLENGTFSNELWFYNATEGGGKWILRAENSVFNPPALSRHTLTMAYDGFLYVFGGSLYTGEFSSKIYRIKLRNDNNDEQWEEIKPRGGKSLEVRLSAHSTVYYRYTNSLVVFGGIMTSLARFSKLSDRIFAFQLDKLHWTEILYPRTALHDSNFPHERAFHSATISGNYMIIYGGYTHRHNKDEICYDNQMYWYHLSCHIWVKRESPTDSLQYPKKQGVFAHSAAVRRNNTLIIVGGYHGNVNADLFAYEFPQILRVRDPTTYNPEEACQFHTSYSSCLSNPECGWCAADTVCYGRTIGANCTTNLQITRCPGICPSLGDCHSCLIHGTPWSSFQSRHFSVANKLGLNQCSWCVQNARCHHKDDNYAICGEDMSQIPGWWGKKGTEVLSPQQCTEYDRRPGLTYIKYHYPVNLTMPDYVSIINATMADFDSPPATTPIEHSLSGEMLARLLGFIRPPSNWDPPQFIICSSYSNAVLRTSVESTLESLKVVDNKTSQHSFCSNIMSPSNEKRVLIDFQAKRKVGFSSPYNSYQKSQLDLQYNSNGYLRAFTFEYLEPFFSGQCGKYKNCLHCLTDSSCGWCDLKSKCFSRTVSESVECSFGEDWRYLIIQPAQCANCSNFISCEECIQSEICEWWAEDARCSRIGMLKTSVRKLDNCPTPCRLRKSCSDCLDEKGRCVWCEAKSQCFSFAVYTTEYQFGMCREWLDQTVPDIRGGPEVVVDGSEAFEISIPKQQQCKPCSQHNNCSSCLKTLSCGWCFDRDNPIEGICLQGDFNHSFGNCSVALNASVQDAEWAYSQCPDVDECGLELHQCHREAKCTNTQGGYNCHCRRGYIGDGWASCIRTCYEACSHGHCSGSPEYICVCDLGWTGPDCSINCGCNYHSTCRFKVGKCDLCRDWTEGERCDRCRPGSYGNATSEEGCYACECNGHGNQDLGICDAQTGECFCKDNTGGLKCEVCNHEYFGDPREGGQCYFQCESRGLLTEIGRKGIGSFQSYKNPWGGPEVRECLWLISPRPVVTESLIQVAFEWPSLNVKCDENAAYIYDSLPDLTGNAPQSQLIAVVCSPYSTNRVIEARSGHMTIHYKQGGESFGFNALYNIRNCGAGTCLTPHICDEKKRCVCPIGRVGPRCDIEICPKKCNKQLLQGYCDYNYGRCVCQSGFGGVDCSVAVQSYHLVVDDIFNTLLLSDSYDHLRKTIPRFGHSLNADKRGSLWMFGGYSLSNGPLNDIRQFDSKNGTWMQVTVESTPEAKMPLGRYFHGADLYPAKQSIYIYGGVTSLERVKPHLFLDDLWHFNIPNQRWEKIEFYKNRPPPLAGHTLTFIKSGDTERMLLVGGTSVNIFTKLILWHFDLDTTMWQELTTTGVRMPALYGHSSVYHSSSQILYVFGGYSHIAENKLYALNLKQMTWSELPPFKELNRPETFLPRSRYFHSAVTTEKYMVVYGGRTEPYNISDTLNVYVYDCNQWIRLNEDVDILGKLTEYTYAEGMTIDQENKIVYIVSGWDGISQSQVTRIHLPVDICQLWSEGKYHCRHYMGCSFCGVSYQETFKSFCFSEGNTNVCDGRKGHIVYNNGVLCDSAWMSRRNCSTFGTCSSCLGSWPSHVENTSICQWCDDCGIKGRCVSAGVNCDKQSTWCTQHTSVELVSMCPLPQCYTLKCEDCLIAHKNCNWAINDVGITECISRDLVVKNDYKIIDECPTQCDKLTTCSSCLNVEAENPTNCKWSTTLNSCISNKIQPLYCAGGVCGLVLDSSESAEHCPEPCHVHSQCSTCLRHAYCGWCSLNDGNGEGVCTEGSLESLAEHPASSTCDIIYASQKNISYASPELSFSWNYVNCPSENECINGHHSCKEKSELCVDENMGYKCICDKGFRDEKGECVPVCTLGCVRGKCIDPDVCKCHFGYVGANCSIQCQCNGNSDCFGPDSLDECLHCFNNTMGKQCDKCQPLFVGNPTKNTPCIPCLTYCNGHTDICLSPDSDLVLFNMSKTNLDNILTEGPIDNATCLNCANNTAGSRCDTCIIGFFRGSDNHRKECSPCQCHGHGDVCDPVTGEKCNCGNNTESDATCTAGGGKNSAQLCWMVQCSKCRDLYAGNPTDGHQCYKQITVESRMCFDGKMIDDCKVKPSPLRPGQTVFFVIQPRFMNVDIRIIIDVTQGELDIFMSPQDDSFIVETNQSTGHHHVFLDNRYRWVSNPSFLTKPLYISPTKYDNTSKNSGSITIDPRLDQKLYWLPHIHDCQSVSGAGFYVKDYHARDLSTYITLNECNTLLRLFSLKNRLVLTLPQTAHNLSATRFFIVVRASVGSDHSYGSIVFRQDQLHIDLFVFFSVFFSCFFLFLAICVVAWKAKQTSDLRRARRRHVVEMLHMAKRPFSCIYVSVNPENDSPIQSRRRGRSKTAASVSTLSVSDIRPVAIEPTSDNIAAVGTVFISLPGKYIAPVTLALGSSLITLPRQYPLTSRTFLRRPVTLN